MTMFAEQFLNASKNVNFANCTVLGKPDEVNNRFFEYFILKKDYFPDKHVNFEQIVGSTHHSDYIGLTWLEMLHQLKRRANYLDILDDEKLTFYTDPNIFHSDGLGEASVVFYNGKGYISEGHHRICIAKFLYACELIPNNTLGPMKVSYVEYNKHDLMRFLAIVEDHFNTLSLGSQIYKIGVEESSQPGHPIYLLMCQTRSGKSFEIRCNTLDELKRQYIDNRDYPRGKISNFFHLIGQKLKLMIRVA